MNAQVDVLGAIDGLRDLARHRLTMKRREFDKMISAGKEPNWLVSVKADRAEYLVQQGDAARDAVAALIAERDALNERLNTNRCNRGHETLPLTLWDCPECHNETRRERDALREALEKLVEAADTSDECRYGTLATGFVRDIARTALTTGESA